MSREERFAPNTKRLYQFSGRGIVYSFTTVSDAPTAFEEQAPYQIALIKLVDGPLITAQLTDTEEGEVEIGTPVEMVTRRLMVSGPKETGYLVYGYKFRPLLDW